MAGIAIELTNGADYNILRDIQITGASTSSTSSIGVYSTGGSNDKQPHSTNLTISVNHSCFKLEGTTGNNDHNNTILNCDLSQMRYGCELYYQDNQVIEGNDIRPGYSGLSSFCYGINVESVSPGDSVVIQGNQIHSFIGDYGGIGVRTEATDCHLIIRNNMIYDYQTTGITNVGLWISEGSADVHFNSIQIGPSDVISGLYGSDCPRICRS